MKKEEPDRSIEEIQEELIQWTVDNRDKLYSPFLTMKGVLAVEARLSIHF
jgi:hypothetical protein